MTMRQEEKQQAEIELKTLNSTRQHEASKKEFYIGVPETAEYEILRGINANV